MKKNGQHSPVFGKNGGMGSNRPFPEENRPDLMKERLRDIGESLESSGEAYALLGLGSAGPESARMDAYSDLDFFAIVKESRKSAFLADLGWLERVAPVAFRYRNTVDGYKAMFDDGVFCEFAVFEPSELRGIPFSRGKIIWKEESFDERFCEPLHFKHGPQGKNREWIVGEVLSNLYVGLCRCRRGEELAATRLIQHFTIDRIMELVELTEEEIPGLRDIFARERRFERRFPKLAGDFGAMVQGYGRNPESARAILEFTGKRHPLPSRMSQIIINLCSEKNPWD